MTERSSVILHIPSLGGGGAERVAIEVAKYLESRGLSVVFFVHTDGAAYELPARTEVVVAKRSSHLGRVFDLRSLIGSRRPAALLSFLPYANLISLLANFGLKRATRLVLSEHMPFTKMHTEDVMAKCKWNLRRWLYQTSHSIIAVSEGVADDLRRTLMGPVANKIAVVYNPCFIPDAIKTTPRLARSERKVLAVGRLVDDKGFDTLIRAFALVRAEMKDVTLTVAGEGPCRRSLEALIQDLGLSGCVSLPGFARDVGSLYRNADLFVCSSRLEGFGNVLVEALSFGLRVVATRCPYGPQEILENGRYGRLVQVDDEKALAREIVDSLSSSHDPLIQMARAQDFSLDVIGARYLEQLGISPSALATGTQQSSYIA
jgi:glycosyltransferase involved in cell wall biosynthesis